MKRLVIILLCAFQLVSCSKNQPEEKDVYYKITSETELKDLGALLHAKKMDDIAGEIKPYFKKYGEKVDIINFDYESTGPDGGKTMLSARMYILDSQLKKGRHAPAMTIANHASITQADQCPTRDLKAEALFAWLGCPVVMPDYYGFGTCGDKPQAYLNAEVTAKGNIDALKAARKLLKDKRVKVEEVYYNVGYSQGGFNTIANLKYVSEHPECNIKFKNSFAGAGSYDINASWDEYMTDKYPAATAFVPLTLTSVNECENLGIPYSDIFKSPLCDHVGDWILSKKYSTGKITELIGSTRMSDILVPGMVTGESPAAKQFRNILDGYSVSKGWKNVKGAKVLLVHSREDDVVPCLNSEILFKALQGAGADVNLLEGNYGGHTDAEINFALAVLNCL